MNIPSDRNPFVVVANRDFNPKADEHRLDPQRWAKERLGVHLWSKQAEPLQALVAHPRVAVRSCHSTGKSFGAAVAVAWWLDIHPPRTARVVTTAPTGDQVKAILWNEINQLIEMPLPVGEKPLLGRVNQTEWWIGNYMAGIGRKPNDYSPAAFQGLHALHLLVVLDEADGLPVTLWNAVETLATNKNARILAIGNPDDPQSEFRRNQSDQDVMNDGNTGSYHTIEIPASSTPNFTGEQVPPLLTDSLLTKEWVADKERRWGVDNPLYISKVLARYPAESEFAVVRISDLIACTRLESSAKVGIRKLGVDIAASEDGDESKIRLREGHQITRVWSKRSSDPDELADWIAGAAIESGVTIIAFDANGVGFGFEGLLKARLPQVTIQPINTGRGADEPNKYVNLRAQLWWGARVALQNRKWDLTYTEDIGTLSAELLTPRWWMVKGRIQVEEKVEIRKRLKRSTDDADAALMATYDGSGSGEAVIHSPAAVQLPAGPRSALAGLGLTGSLSGQRRGQW